MASQLVGFASLHILTSWLPPIFRHFFSLLHHLFFESSFCLLLILVSRQFFCVLTDPIPTLTCCLDIKDSVSPLMAEIVGKVRGHRICPRQQKIVAENTLKPWPEIASCLLLLLSPDSLFLRKISSVIYMRVGLHEAGLVARECIPAWLASTVRES